MNKLNFIIIGAQKAYTSSMLHILNQHQDIYLPKNEIDIFEVNDFNDYENYFEELFKNSNKRVNGIKRPNYIGLQEVPEKIESYGKGNIKLIAILRNPVKRIISQYNMHARQGLLPTFNIDKNLNKIMDKDKKFLKKYPHSLQLLENGLYSKYLSLYINSLNNENILVLSMKDILNDPEKYYKLVFSFLGVGFENLDFELKVNAEKDNNLIVKKVTSFRSSIIYKRDFNSGNIIIKTKRKFYEKVFIRALNLLIKLFNNFQFPNQSINKETIKRLEEFYKDEIEETKKLFDVKI